MDSLTFLIGDRFAIARGASVSQEALAKALGFNDRQTVSAIEVGERKVTPEELVKAARFFDKPLDFFTDPYLVPEKATFSYRASTLDGAKLKTFENQAERLISAQRRFRTLLDDPASPVHAQLPDVTRSTPLSMATYRGEQTAAAWKLGDTPAWRLCEVAEEKLSVSVFFVDAPDEISGAACFLSDGGVVLINRRESAGRRNFNLGHELFHLLTWSEMPPERLDYEPEAPRTRSRTEQLADAFTGGLLMPSANVHARWLDKGRASFASWLSQHASELGVSPLALYTRLAIIGLIDRNDVPYPTQRPAGTRSSAVPKLYNLGFVTRLQQVLERGNLTVLRAIELLDCSIEELAALFRSYELTVPFDV
jgi:Zn-dependent peptidase ImmA (M78 family)/transcriptional regulator with XRE-family HTH domain